MTKSLENPRIKRKLLLYEAHRWIGTTETNNNQGQLVNLFQKAVDGISSGEAWCAGFAMYCIKNVDNMVDFALQYSSCTRSEIYKSEHCLTIWNKSPKHLRTPQPRPGNLIIWQHYRNNKPTSSGHIGIVYDMGENDLIRTIEGNTSDSKSIIREGDGVFLKTRSVISGQTMKVKGFLKIWGEK